MKTKLLASALVISSLTLAAAGLAQGVNAQVSATPQAPVPQVTQVQADDSQFIVKVGVAVVVPQSNNGTLASGAFKADIGSSASMSLSLEYLLMKNEDIGNLGVELLAAYPFHNSINLSASASGAHVAKGSVNVLPPTLTVQYHFLPNYIVSPFVGVGLNYTLMYGARIDIPGASVRVKNSWGVAPHAGVEFNINKNWLVSADVRWVEMKNDVSLDGGGIGSVNINPWVFGVQAGYRF